MTQNSRRRSGSRPFDVGLRKSEEDARESSRAAVQEARDMNPRQRATLERQVTEYSDAVTAGASKKTLAAMTTRFAAEREADALASTADRVIPEAASN